MSLLTDPSDLRLAARLPRRPLLARTRDPRADRAARGDLLRRRAARARAVRRGRAAGGVRRGAPGRRAGRALQYSTTEGDPALRAAVAARLTAPRACRPTADDLLVTSGSQQALTLLATVLLEPGDAVLVEDPTYLAALQCFGSPAREVVPVPVRRRRHRPGRARGARRPRSAPEAALPRARPSRTRPAARSRSRGAPALAEVAARHGLWIVEDDPYGELRYDGEPQPCDRLAARRRGPHAVLSALLQGRSRPGCGSAGCARPRRCARPLPWPSRPPTCTPRPSTRPPPPATSPTSTSTPICAACAPPTARAATRCSPAWPTRCPPGSPGTGPRAACSSGRGCPTARTPTALLRRALAHDVAFVPGAPFFAGPPDRATLRLSFTDAHRRRRSRRACGACAPPWEG